MTPTVSRRRALNTTSTEGALGLGEISTPTLSTDGSHADHTPSAPRRAQVPSVVVVEARQLIAEALATLLGSGGNFAVRLFAPDVVDAAALIAIGPDLVLIDTGDAQEDSLRLLDCLRRLAPGCAAILADSLRPELVRFVLDQRTDALVLTDMAAEDLTATLSQVLHGQTVLPAGWQAALTTSSSDPVASLSKRQLEVLRLLGADTRMRRSATDW